jgi:hypothetical protein
MYRGDTAAWDFTVTEPDGTAVDLTDADGIRFTAKDRASDADVDARIAKTLGDGVTVTNAAAGVVRVQLATDDTSALSAPLSLAFDLQLADAVGGVYTVAAGKLEIKADISRTAP